MHICEHCSKNFSSKSNLTRHINRNYCNILNKQKSNTSSNNTEINIQTNVTTNFITNKISNIHILEPDDEEIVMLECAWCNNTFNSDKDYSDHEKNCEIEYLKISNKKMFNELNNKLNNLTKCIDLFINEPDKRDSILSLLNELKKTNTQEITEVKIRKTPIKNIGHLKGVFPFNNISLFNNILQEHVDTDCLEFGLEGFAKIITNHFIKNENEETFKYVCTNTSRKVFRFYNDNKKIVQDTNAAKLISFILKSNYKQIFEKVKDNVINNLDNQLEKDNIWSTKNNKIQKEIAEINHNFCLIINIEKNANSFARYLTKYLST